MTNQEKQQLSRDVAVKYGIEPYFVMPATLTRTEVWLHEDSARCFDLMVEHGIDLTHSGQFKVAIWWPYLKRGKRFVDYYNYDKRESARIAILKALLAKGE